VGEGVRGSDPREVGESKQWAGDEEADEESCEHPWSSENANDRSPEQVVLLLDGERPRGANSGRQCDVKEILQEEDVSPPGCGSEGFEDGLADEPGSVEITDDEDENVYGPDAESATRVEVAEVAGLAAGFEEDGGDEESGEDEEEIDAGPSPERGLVEEGVFEARMAVVEDDAEDGDAAEPLEFGDVGGEPGWALDGQGVDGCNEIDCTGSPEKQPRILLRVDNALRFIDANFGSENVGESAQEGNALRAKLDRSRSRRSRALRRRRMACCDRQVCPRRMYNTPLRRFGGWRPRRLLRG